MNETTENIEYWLKEMDDRVHKDKVSEILELAKGLGLSDLRKVSDSIDKLIALEVVREMK